MDELHIDFQREIVTIIDDGQNSEVQFDDEKAFFALSQAWLRLGWDLKYVYAFSWFGRPVIQLPEDLIRIQEVIYQVQPDVIVETGVAHGGSLVFYASLFEAMGRGKVIGVDVEIRSHNRAAIDEHPLAHRITLIEGSSTEGHVVDEVYSHVRDAQNVMVVLDSNHTKNHVLAEMAAYSPLVTSGSYLVVCDGIAKYVAGAPRTSEDWSWNNPIAAIDEFLMISPDFEEHEPVWPFNESEVSKRVTYWPRGYLRKR